MNEISSERRRRRRPAFSLLALVVVFVCGVVVGAAWHRFGWRSAAGLPGREADALPATAWWRAHFPPPAMIAQSSLPDVKLDPAEVLPDLACGSLDGAQQANDQSIFIWGWAYDPRTNSPAPAVILFDNGRQLSPPVAVFRDRPDVAAAKGSSRLISTGWSVRLPAGRLTGGEHVFEAFALLADRKLGRLGGKIAVQSPKGRAAGPP